MGDHLVRGATLGADKDYAVREFVQPLEQRGIRAHFAHDTANGRRSAIDERTTLGKGYGMGQQIRKRIEQGFGWSKTIGGLDKRPVTTLSRVRHWMTWSFVAHNRIRIGGVGE